MAALTIQQVQVTGTELTAIGNHDATLHAINGSGGSITVTVAVPGSRYGQANPDIAVAIPAGEERMIKLLPDFADSDGDIDISYSGVTSLTVAVFRS